MPQRQAKKERKRVAQLEHVLLPDAPPRKRQSRRPSPARLPCPVVDRIDRPGTSHRPAPSQAQTSSVAINKTWLRDGEDGSVAPQIPIYKLCHVPCRHGQQQRGGGVGFYIKQECSDQSGSSHDPSSPSQVQICPSVECRDLPGPSQKRTSPSTLQASKETVQGQVDFSSCEEKIKVELEYDDDEQTEVDRVYIHSFLEIKEECDMEFNDDEQTEVEGGAPVASSLAAHQPDPTTSGQGTTPSELVDTDIGAGDGIDPRTSRPSFGVTDTSFDRVITDFDNFLTDSDDDEPNFDNTVPERDTVFEPSHFEGMSDAQAEIVEAEDAANDRALRDMLGYDDSDMYKFDWSSDRNTLLSKRETFNESTGPTFSVTDETRCVDVFDRMFDAEFIDRIVAETNRYAVQKIALMRAQNKLSSGSRYNRWTPTDRDEIISFLAVQILQGLYPLPEEEAYFKFNGFGTLQYFPMIMSYNRLVLLKTMLHFVDNDTIMTKTKLCKIQPVIEHFNHKFSSLYMPSQEVAIDESLLKWHGRLNFSQKIRSKAAKVGVKTYELCESSSGYLWKFKVYTGKDRPDHDRLEGVRPDGDRPDHDTPDGDRPNHERPDHDRLEGDTPDGDGPNHDRLEGDTPDGDGPNHDRLEGDRFDLDRLEGDRFDPDRLEGASFALDRLEGDRFDLVKLEGNRFDLDKLEGNRFDLDRLEGDRFDHDRLHNDRPDRLTNDSSIVRPTNATAQVVFDLMEPLLHRGHTLVMDNFFNSPLLLRCLKRQKTDCYGTLRANREFVPEYIKTLTKPQMRTGEVVSAYCSDLAVFAMRDNNIFTMISTFHKLHVGTVDKNNKTKHKPTIVLDYNKNMGGIDRKDQFLSAQPMERLRNRVWYKKLFRRLCNVAIFNCFVIFSSHHRKISHRQFRNTLAEDLLKRHKRIDLTTEPRIVHSRRSATGLVATTTTRPTHRTRVDSNHFPIPTGSKNTRCSFCKKCRTSWKCEECNVNLCLLICFKAHHKA